MLNQIVYNGLVALWFAKPILYIHFFQLHISFIIILIMYYVTDSRNFVKTGVEWNTNDWKSMLAVLRKLGVKS